MRHNLMKKLSTGLSGSALAMAMAFSPMAVSANTAEESAATLAADEMAANTEAGNVDAAPISELISAVDIPYEEFTLDNGLKVIIHEDHKAPIVAVSVWYGVGSKHEPKGKTGYAHLFEHIMFNGSENAPGDYFDYTKRIGATDLNGTTWLDRTNYFQNVPKAALESALFLESDRMGHLLGALDREALDNQIKVVSNEKRQGDSQPYGMVSYKQIEMLFPETHPYGHSTIGSLEDLHAASLDDMKNWFIDHYGPNNSILVLAGDITAAEAKPLVEKYFGSIAPGKPLPKVDPALPTLSKVKTAVLKDKVANARLSRSWVVPGRNDKDIVALDAAATLLGGLNSSRLDNILVRDEQLTVRVSTSLLQFVHASILEIEVDIKDGVDVATIEKRLDEILADLITNGPDEEEIDRVATVNISGTIAGLENIGGFGGKAVALARGKLFSNNPEKYKDNLKTMASLTPADVQAAMKKWMSRPYAQILVEPGERENYVETVTTSDEEDTRNISADFSKMPPLGKITDLVLPEVQEATLSNGVKVYYAQRDAVPRLNMSLVFDAGSAADPMDKSGLHGLMVAMLDEGTNDLSAKEIAETQELLGASISVSSDTDNTSFIMSTLSPNITPTLDLLEDMVKNPAFDADELERVRALQLSTIARENTQPIGLALRFLPPMIYGPEHPYGKPLTGTGEAQIVSTLSRDELVNFHQTWIRPEKMKIFMVGDADFDSLIAEMDERFGNWTVDAPNNGTKNVDAPVPAAQAKILVINQPNSPQSLVLGGEVLNAKGTDDLLDFEVANEILGGDFLSRINADLREKKGWSYGSATFYRRPEGRIPFLAYLAVQADKTGPSIAAVIDHFKGFTSDNGATAAELQGITSGNILELPGQFEAASDVLSQMIADEERGRSFDYAEKLPDLYRAMTTDSVNKAMKNAIVPDQFVWLVVGDAAKVEPQLKELGIPVIYQGYTPKSDEKSGE